MKEDKLDKQKHIRDEVEKTMSLLDRVEKLEAGPYFYTRVESRLRSREKEEKAKLPGILGVRVLKPAFLVLLLMINIISAVFFLVESKDTGLADKTYSSQASQLVQEYWPSQDTYDIPVTKMMTEGNK